MSRDRVAWRVSPLIIVGCMWLDGSGPVLCVRVVGQVWGCGAAQRPGGAGGGIMHSPPSASRRLTEKACALSSAAQSTVPRYKEQTKIR
jgi:hypothetical protein